MGLVAWIKMDDDDDDTLSLVETVLTTARIENMPVSYKNSEKQTAISMQLKSLVCNWNSLRVPFA